MIEAFRIGVQMTMDAADTQSAVVSLARDFTSLNGQITQSQSGLSAVRAGLSDLAGQQKSLQRDQAAIQTSVPWQAATGLARTEPMATNSPVVRSHEQGSATGLAAPVAPVGVAAPHTWFPIGQTPKDWASGGDGFQTNTPREPIVFDPAMAMLPSLATLLARNDPRSATSNDLTKLRSFAPLSEDGIGIGDLPDRSPASSRVPPGDGSLLNDLSSSIAGLAGANTVGAFAIDHAHHLDFPTAARGDDRFEHATPEVDYAGERASPHGWSVSPSDVDTASTLAVAVARLTSTATDAARMLAAIPGGSATAAAQNQSHTTMFPPMLPEAPGVGLERPAPDEPHLARRAGASDDGRANEATPVVIHTDVHLDGQVIAQAVTQQIVDWMNGPLPGGGGFDPRRSYTPVES
jgi:hypothetical protein